jgi:hypothetical protein
MIATGLTGTGACGRDGKWHLALERLVQAHRDEPCFGCYQPFPAEDLDSLRDLTGIERIERMACSVAALLTVGLWPSVAWPGHLAVSYHRRSLPPPGAAFPRRLRL